MHQGQIAARNSNESLLASSRPQVTFASPRCYKQDKREDGKRQKLLPWILRPQISCCIRLSYLYYQEGLSILNKPWQEVTVGQKRHSEGQGGLKVKGKKGNHAYLLSGSRVLAHTDHHGNNNENQAREREERGKGVKMATNK